MRMRDRWACTASATNLRQAPEAATLCHSGVVISIVWSTKYSGILNPGVFSSYGSSKVLSHEENAPVLYSPRHYVSVSRKSCTKPPCYCGKSAMIHSEESPDIKFWCLHINNRPRHEKFSCELFTKAQCQDKFSGISAFSDIKSSHQTWKNFSWWIIFVDGVLYFCSLRRTGIHQWKVVITVTNLHSTNLTRQAPTHS